VRSLQLYAQQTKLLVEVTYGSSKIKPNRREVDLIIANYEEMIAAGLPQATRFDLDRNITLPWCKEFFPCREGDSTPIVGHLAPRSVEQLERLKGIRARASAVARKEFKPG